MHNDPLLQILILLAASIGVVAGVRKLALPAILGYLVVGMLLGPHALSVAVWSLRWGWNSPCRDWWPCAGRSSASAARRCW